jgi:hypothetical protein
VRDRPPCQAGRGPCSPTVSLDRLTVQSYLLVRLSHQPGALAWAARVPTSSRELPRWARAWPPAGVCLVGLVVTPARCSQADAARAALPPYAARAAQPLSLADIARPVVSTSGPGSLGRVELRGLEPLDLLLAKEVDAPGGPAAAQVESAAGCSVSDRESPWVTLLTGTWRARTKLTAGSPDHLPVARFRPSRPVRSRRTGLLARFADGGLAQP